MNQKDQRALFVRNELKVLQGNKRINVWVLSLILFITFVGLGHSVGGLQNLKERMDNPFTLWVNLPVPARADYYQKAESMVRHFADPTTRDSFLLDTIIGYNRDFLEVQSFDQRRKYNLMGRSIQPEESLVAAILKNDNIKRKHSDYETMLSSENSWLIVKQESLEALGFPPDISDDLQLQVVNPHTQEVFFTHYIPVLAVVKDLPDLVDVVMPEHLQVLLYEPVGETGFVNISKTNRIDFLSKEELDEEDVSAKIQDITLEDTFALKMESMSYEPFIINGEEHNKYELFLTPPLDIFEKENVMKLLRTHYSLRPYTEFNVDLGRTYYIQEPYYLAFHFKNLQKVRALRDMVKKEYGFEISINQVEDKENFAKIAALTLLLTILLFVLSMAGVMVFTANLLQSHIEKIKVNLGTFKAFGLSDKALIADYNRIVMIFSITSIVISLFFTSLYYGLHLAGKAYSIKWFLDADFNLFHWSVLLALLGIVLGIRFSLKTMIASRLRKTPGDLIYQR